MQSHASRHVASEFLVDRHPDLSPPFPAVRLCMWTEGTHDAALGCMSLLQTAWCCMRLHKPARGCMRMLQTACGCMRLHAAA
eukprot:365115-Chlamydomonas_euryale.AAC.1